MNTSIFKAYDVRGIYPTDVNEEAIKQIARACVKLFPEGEIIVAYDARHGSVELAKVMGESIIKAGTEFNKKVSVKNIGLSTTPMFYFTVVDQKAVGGCMITASHNPKNYNGVKAVNSKAEMLTGKSLLEIIGTL